MCDNLTSCLQNPCIRMEFMVEKQISQAIGGEHGERFERAEYFFPILFFLHFVLCKLYGH